MSDLITVTMDALQTEFDNEVVRAVQNVGIYVDKEKLIEALQLAESLVRCKDCKWWKDNIGYYSVSFCPWDEDIGVPDADDFCSFGERREDGEA